LAGKTKAVTEHKRLVLDANILLRAVFGVRVRALLETYEDSVSFYTPDICFGDARKYIPVITATRQFDPASGLIVLNQLARLVEIVDQSLYEEHESSARERMLSRDVSGTGQSWQPHCCSIAPSGPKIQDFFGSGIATWTTNNVELYLRDA
jgi:PIN domain